MFQDAMVTKAFMCYATATGIAFEEVVLQIRISETEVRTIGWHSKTYVRQSTSGSMSSSFFLDHTAAKQILAMLVMSQTLRVGNAVVLFLLGVMQGSYSGAQSIDGILAVSEIGFSIGLLVSRYRWVLAHYMCGSAGLKSHSVSHFSVLLIWLAGLNFPK